MPEDERLRIPLKRRATCELCDGELDVQAKGVHQWTAGWVRQRAGGGGHGVSCPVRSHRWAHGDCVDQLAAGQLLQGALF
jgi:hypothetical protein